LRQQFISKRYNIVLKDLSSHCAAAPAAGFEPAPDGEAFARINAGEKVEKFRAVRDLVGSKVKTLFETLD
jgi:hypothetical protein